MEFITFIGWIIILVITYRLRARVQKLEQIIKEKESLHTLEAEAPQNLKTKQQTPNLLLNYIDQQLKQGTKKEAIEKSLLAIGWKTTDIEKSLNLVMNQAEDMQLDSEKEEPVFSDKLAEWLKDNWLLKLGAFLLLIGFGWLTTYAFLNNWIGPMGRIALGVSAGAFFIILGFWRIKNYLNQGGIFLVLGSTTILLTMFAARTVYDFFTPSSALAVMFLSTAFVALASVIYKSRNLSLLSLVFAAIAPMFTNSPATDHVGLFAYLFVVILSAIWIVALTGQRELTMAALVIVFAYSLPHLISSPSFPLVDNQTLLLFAYAFATLFFLTSITGILKSKFNETVLDLVTAALNGLLLLAWIMSSAQEEWKSLIIAVWMVIFTVGAFLVFKITQRLEPFYVYAGVGIMMLAAATSVELNGSTLTIAYTIESGLVALISYMILQDIKIAERSSFLMLGPISLSITSILSFSWTTGMLHKDFFVLLVLGLTLFGLGVFFYDHLNETDDQEPRQINATLLIVGSMYAYILLWRSLHAEIVNDNNAVMIALVIYTIIGLTAYFHGLANGRNRLRVYGGALVGFVVGRLLLVDIWTMEMAGRIVTFFLIGALLVSTAFLGRNKT